MEQDYLNEEDKSAKCQNDDKKPEISVIVPIYNVASYLDRCLESVINQTFANFEAICINDGSTDNSLEIVKKYAAKDSRIKVISQTNQGLSAARNTGLSTVRGKYIAFLDSDDFYAPEFLEILYQALQKSKCDIAGCNFMKIKSEKDILPRVSGVESEIYKDALKVLLHRRNFIHFNVWNKLYTREVIGNIRFVPDMYYEDWVFNCCVFERAKSFCWVKEKLYGYRLSNSSIMRSCFTERKLNDYVRGINEVYGYFKQNAPEKWNMVCRTRISRTVKMMMNSARRSCNFEISQEMLKEIKYMKLHKIITYHGLSFINKIKLFIFLNKGN